MNAITTEEFSNQILCSHINGDAYVWNHNCQVIQSAIDQSTSAMRDELEKWKTEAHNLLWNLAGCDTYAMGYGLDSDHDKSMARPALESCRKMALQNAEFRAQLSAMRDELERVNNGVKARFTAPIVCMCGSTKFKQSWIAENARLTGEGFIVLAVGLWGHHERQYPPDDIKAKLDEIHKRKIDLCDWVWVLDVGGYVGSSTKSEILYAQQLGKQVRYLSHEFPNYVEPADPLATQLADQSAKMASLEAQIEDQRNHLEWFGNDFVAIEKALNGESSDALCRLAQKAAVVVKQRDALESQAGAMAKAVIEIMSFLPTEGDILDNAALSDGRVNDFDRAVRQLRNSLTAQAGNDLQSK